MTSHDDIFSFLVYFPMSLLNLLDKIDKSFTLQFVIVRNRRKIGMTQGGLHPAPSIYCLQRGEERLSSLESPSVGQLRAS